MPELLAARARDEPDRTAILLPDGRSLTFGQWQARSTAAARGLSAAGAAVGRGDRVGLRFGGGEWIGYAVAFLAVQKAGGVPVPLSTKLPDSRAARLLAHCRAVGVVAPASAAPGDAAGLWASTVDWLEDAGGPGPLPEPPGPDDLAQIVYTSGTTGRPKGVAASHANVTYGYPPRPRQRRFAHSRLFLHAFPIGTNGAQTMLMYALAAHPAALAMPAFDSAAFAALVEEHRVGTVFLVPTMAIDLLNSRAYERHDLSSVLLVTSSADALPPAVAAGLPKAFPSATIVNYYTSTEAAPADTTMVVDPARPASAGRPARRGDILIADGHGRPLPPGETGEVWLRSPAAARSYFGDPEGSAGTFRDGRVRMGDLGYLDEDGYLFLVDRDGDVVKSGGHRVSTLQVEAALYEHPAVAEAAVLGVPHPVLGTAVAAAVVLRPASTADDLRGYLAGRLARYETPTRIAVVESLPRNEAGKVVKAELRGLFAAPAPPAPPDAAGPAAPPRTPTEVALARLWRRVLNAGPVRADDDFFALGGESLRATQLATLASDEFGVAMGVGHVFDAPTLSRLAERIDALRADAAAGPGDAEAGAAGDAGVPLGATLEYFLHWTHAGPDRRQIQPVSLALRVEDELDLAALAAALDDLVARHEMLRASFTRSGSGFAVTIRDGAPVDLSIVDAVGATLVERERHALALACAEVERPFDIAAGAMLRALVVRLDGADTLPPAGALLVLVVEHLAFDGASFGVLLRELGLLYSARRLGRPSPLPPVPLRTGEFFSATRRRWPANREFWRRRLAGAPRSLAPIPGHDPAATRYVGRTVDIEVPAAVADRLRAAAREHRATTFMAALAGWCGVLREWTAAEDIVVQVPITGRTHLEYESLVGCVVQLLMIRVPVPGGEPFADLLGRVRSRVIEATDHQAHRFLDAAGAVPYPAHFFFESWGGPAHLPGVVSRPVALPPELCLTWTFAEGDPDLSVPRLSLVEYPGGPVAGRLLYNAEAFEAGTVQALGRSYLAFLDTRLEERS
jgi:acyl-CoA synthetase (AMP-forming)/AMP-acid ligase II